VLAKPVAEAEVGVILLVAGGTPLPGEALEDIARKAIAEPA
jgi:hypothetical protein